MHYPVGRERLDLLDLDLLDLLDLLDRVGLCHALAGRLTQTYCYHQES